MIAYQNKGCYYTPPFFSFTKEENDFLGTKSTKIQLCLSISDIIVSKENNRLEFIGEHGNGI